MDGYGNSFKIGLFIFIALISSISTNCAQQLQLKKATPQKTETYSFVTSNSGIQIAVDLYKDQAKLQEYFGCDLLSRGLLPVFVVIENQTASDGYILLPDGAKLLMSDQGNNQKNDGSQNDELTNARQNNTNANTIGAAAIAMLGAIGIAVALPIMFATENQVANEYDIGSNMEQKRLVTKTVYQGCSHSGFLYFNIGNKEALELLQGISLKAKNIRTNEMLPFTIVLR